MKLSKNIVITAIVAGFIGIGAGAAGAKPETVEVPGPTQTVTVNRDVPGPTVYVNQMPDSCSELVGIQADIIVALADAFRAEVNNDRTFDWDKATQDLDGLNTLLGVAQQNCATDSAPQS